MYLRGENDNDVLMSESNDSSGHGDADRRLERWATTSVFFANGLGIGAWAAAIPRFGVELALSPAQLSIVLLSFAAGAVTAMPLSGRVGSRVRTGPATWIAGLWFTAALLLPVFASSLAVLCAAAIVLGAGNGAVDVLMNAHASGIERSTGKPIMSSFHAAFSLGGVAGAALGGALGAWHASAGLWGPSVIGILVVMASAGVLHRQGTTAAASSLAAPSRALIPLCLLALLCMLAEGAVADWSGTYLAQSSNSLALASAGYAAFSGCMVLGRLCGDRLVERLSAAAVVRAGGVLATSGFLLAVIWPGLISGAVGFGLVGLGLSNVVPVVFSAASRAGSSPAAGVSMAATAGYAGFLLGPVAIGAVAGVSSLRSGMAVLAVAAGVLVALSMARQLKHQYPMHR